MPIETNAYTPIDDDVYLSHGHSAYGAKLDPRVVAALTPVIPVISANMSVSAAESLEASTQQQQQSAPGQVQPSSGVVTSVSVPVNDTASLNSPVQSFPSRRRHLEATSQNLQRLESHFGISMERNTAKLVKKANFLTIP